LKSSSLTAIHHCKRIQDFGQCDSKKCSGRKMCRLGAMKELPLQSRFPGIILTPMGVQAVSPADCDVVRDHGICVVDCSWAHIDTVPFGKLKGSFPRLCNYSSCAFVGVRGVHDCAVQYHSWLQRIRSTMANHCSCHVLKLLLLVSSSLGSPTMRTDCLTCLSGVLLSTTSTGVDALRDFVFDNVSLFITASY
jgi:hypothetical protein